MTNVDLLVISDRLDKLVTGACPVTTGLPTLAGMLLSAADTLDVLMASLVAETVTRALAAAGLVVIKAAGPGTSALLTGLGQVASTESVSPFGLAFSCWV